MIKNRNSQPVPSKFASTYSISPAKTQSPPVSETPMAKSNQRLSPSSIFRDYVRKAGKYAEAGVREYWIVDPQKETVMIYHFPEDATPSLFPLKGRIPVGIFNNELEIDFDEINERIIK